MSGGWTAILLAGNRPGENGFAEANGVAAKPLIPVGGEPMIGRVVRSLLASPSIARVLILAQQPERMTQGALAWIGAEPRVALATGGDGISRSIADRAGTADAPWPILVTTADHALLSVPMVESFLAGADGTDVAFALVDRTTLEAAYPHNRRTWLRFSDGDFSGANLFALRGEAARAGLDLWASVEQDRKKAARLALRFGPLLALRLLTRTIALDATVARIGRRLGLTARAVRLPFAEAAIDVDKPSDLALVEQIVAARG